MFDLIHKHPHSSHQHTCFPRRLLLMSSLLATFISQDSVTNFYVSRKKGVAGLQNMFKGMLT